jgi:ubiquinol-cytochrome c reductase cytochrome c1 subunit
LSEKLSVSAHSFSKSAAEKIEAAGGSVTWLKPPHEKKVRRHKKAKAAPAPAAQQGEAAEEAAAEEAPSEEPAAEEPAAEAEES